MQMIKTRLPEGITGIANLMGMSREEVRAWPYYTEVRGLFKDYNLRALKRENLIEKLYDVSLRCANSGIYHYSTGIEKAIASIRTFY